jgi:hypothetical protein
MGVAAGWRTPSLRSATAVLAATWGKSVNRVPARVADCPRNACRTRGEGCAAQPRIGSLGFRARAQRAGDMLTGANAHRLAPLALAAIVRQFP